MEDMEISSWATLDAVKKAADIVDTVGNLQSGHWMSVFCEIEDDFLELCYSDATANYLRRYEDKDEFEVALEQRKSDIENPAFEKKDSYAEDAEEEEENEDEESPRIEEESGEF